MADGELSPSRIGALVRLLADDNEKIRRIARDNLIACIAAGCRALSIVEETARGTEDPQVRVAARRFLKFAQREEALSGWIAFAAGSELDLETGACLIAKTEFPDFDPHSCRQTLDGYAEVLKKRLAAIRSPDAIIERINALLFKDLGFRGNREDYYDPLNSYLNMVCERKLGIPISLCAIYLFVSRRLGLKVEGVGMPGHFIISYRAGRHARFVDAFDKGKRWTHQDCLDHLVKEGYGFREEYLRPASDREILVRMLANLLGIYHSRQDAARTDRVTRMLAAIQR